MQACGSLRQWIRDASRRHQAFLNMPYPGQRQLLTLFTARRRPPTRPSTRPTCAPLREARRFIPVGPRSPFDLASNEPDGALRPTRR